MIVRFAGDVSLNAGYHVVDINKEALAPQKILFCNLRCAFGGANVEYCFKSIGVVSCSPLLLHNVKTEATLLRYTWGDNEYT